MKKHEAERASPGTGEARRVGKGFSSTCSSRAYPECFSARALARGVAAGLLVETLALPEASPSPWLELGREVPPSSQRPDLGIFTSFGIVTSFGIFASFATATLGGPPTSFGPGKCAKVNFAFTSSLESSSASRRAGLGMASVPSPRPRRDVVPGRDVELGCAVTTG